MKKIVVTGNVGSGKSTFLKKILEDIKDKKVNGIFTVKEDVEINMYKFVDNELIIESKFTVGTCGKKFPTLNDSAFEKKGVEYLSQLHTNEDIFVIDEIGVLENGQESYQKNVLDIWQSETDCIFVLKKKDGELIDKILNSDVDYLKIDLDEKSFDEAIELIDRRFLATN